MKGDFVPKFIAILQEMRYALKDASREISRVKYKGVSYKSFYARAPNREKFQKGIYNLRKRGIIEEGSPGYFRLTSRGVQWSKRTSLNYFRQRYPEWDGKWRVILFDIPSELHKQRVQFRRKLKGLGCLMMQKSVFIFPYSCEEELGPICQILGISSYVDVILAENAGFKNKEIRKHFGL